LTHREKLRMIVKKPQDNSMKDNRIKSGMIGEEKCIKFGALQYKYLQ
jgi:hypothetical protein